jgi:hypothetical protein
LLTRIMENLDQVQRRTTKMVKWLRGPIYKELRNVWLRGNYPKKGVVTLALSLNSKPYLARGLLSGHYIQKCCGGGVESCLSFQPPHRLLGWYSPLWTVTSTNKHRRQYPSKKAKSSFKEKEGHLKESLPRSHKEPI